MYKTEQEAFWAGEFGNEYIQRNKLEALVPTNTALFSKVLARLHGVTSVLELGANIGANMLALQRLLPGAALEAVEINPAAHKQLSAIPGVKAHLSSILQYQQQTPVDLSFTKGVLIHLNPDELPTAYDLLYRSSRKYVAVIEYYNQTPVEVTYRGHSARLFKRDWCAELMKRHPDLTLIDYGFIYHLDPMFPADDITWFVMEKS